MKSSLLPAAAAATLLATTTVAAHPHGPLYPRDQQQPTVSFNVYKLALCITTGYVDQVKTYQLPTNGTCVDTLPTNTNPYDANFLSFEAGNQQQQGGQVCYYTVYEQAECQGRQRQFSGAGGQCQDALLGNTQQGLQYGGMSAMAKCYNN